MIKLHSFGSNLNMVDPSPFVLKVDIFMRMAGIQFEHVPSVNNLSRAPKGKLPFIVDGDITIADSHFIILYLKNKYNVDLDSQISSEQRHIGYLMAKSLDENLYWCLLHSRWADDSCWAYVKEAFFGSMPFPVKYIVPLIARRDIISALKKQGMGKHSEEEIKILARESFDSLSAILGQQTYFFGEAPCSFDVSAFAFLGEFILTTLDNEYNDIARSYDNLVKYCNNMQAQYY